MEFLPDCNNGTALYSSGMECKQVSGADSKSIETLVEGLKTGILYYGGGTIASPNATQIQTEIQAYIKAIIDGTETGAGEVSTITDPTLCAGSATVAVQGTTVSTFGGVFGPSGSLIASAPANFTAQNGTGYPGPLDTFQCACNGTKAVAWVIPSGTQWA